MTLTVKGIKKLTEPGRYPDGDNLYLQISPTGGRSTKYTFNEMGSGTTAIYHEKLSISYHCGN